MKLSREFNNEHNHELLYIVMLALCFGFAILANQIGFSVAIGAFLIGVVAARARAREEINRAIDPLQHVFGAIFFVSMGALMDVTKITVYWLPRAHHYFSSLGNKTCELRFWNTPLWL